MNIKKILIATHGKLARGIKDTLEIVSGPQDNVTSLCFYSENHEVNQKELLNVFDNLKNDEQLIICTDIQYGSVNQILVRETLNNQDKNIEIISGINLPVMLEIITTPGILLKNQLEEMVEKASKQLVRIDLEAVFKNNVDDDIFGDER